LLKIRKKKKEDKIIELDESKDVKKEETKEIEED